MLDRLAAEEDMAAATAAAAGMATKPGDWVRRQWRQWERRARGGRRERAARPTPADLAAIGVRFVEEPKRNDG